MEETPEQCAKRLDEFVSQVVDMFAGAPGLAIEIDRVEFRKLYQAMPWPRRWDHVRNGSHYFPEQVWLGYAAPGHPAIVHEWDFVQKCETFFRAHLTTPT